MKTIKFLSLLIVGFVFFASCSKDDDDNNQKVSLSATLINKDGSIATEGETKEITYEVILSRSVDTELKLTFDVDNPTQNKDLFQIQNPVIIKKGETKGVLRVKILSKVDAYKELTKDATFTLKLKSAEGTTEKVNFDNDAYSFIIKPKADIIPLTEAQRKLIKTYEKNGIDIAKWIGKVRVEAKVTFGGNSNLDAFNNNPPKTYTGYTIIMLSEKATEDKPILKMTSNAFGLSEYLQWVFRNETIENAKFWMQQSAPQAVMQALGQERVDKWKNKGYSFDVSVDNILVKPDNTIEFVYKDGAFSTYADFLKPADERTEKVSAVNFEYYFPLWNELVKLTKGNDPLKTNIQQGGSVQPNNYIGNSTILLDEFGRGNWVEPKGVYDNSKMTFIFNTDYTDSGDYDKIEVTITPN